MHRITYHSHINQVMYVKNSLLKFLKNILLISFGTGKKPIRVPKNHFNILNI